MSRKMVCASVGFLLLVFQVGVAGAASHDFFRDKRVRILVGFTPGGAFDTYARIFARHMGKYLAGQPKFIVENMPGAAGLLVANHLYNAAKPDGLTMGTFIGGVVLGQVLGRPGVEFDALKFEYVGAPDRNHAVCAFSKASGITSVEKWMAKKTPVALGATGPGATTHDVPTILQTALGLPIQLVAGYQGPTEIQVAIQRGELAGLCNAWESLRVTSIEEIKAGDLVVVLQAVPRALPELPPDVPLAVDLARTKEARQLIQAGIHEVSAIVRLYALPPGTPKERVEMLRRAFMDTIKDPQYVAEIKKARLDLNPLDGRELEDTVRRLVRVDPATLAALKQVLK